MVDKCVCCTDMLYTVVSNEQSVREREMRAVRTIHSGEG